MQAHQYVQVAQNAQKAAGQVLMQKPRLVALYAYEDMLPVVGHSPKTIDQYFVGLAQRTKNLVLNEQTRQRNVAYAGKGPTFLMTE